LNDLRQKNISATMDFASRSMKAQMKQAAKSGAKFALIIGEDEVNDKSVTVKNLQTSAQEKISVDNVAEKF
ncbi:MAG: histidine--tRNA ligase, partial [Selenomonadaceae bacterium]|nr:histidine--tRNA ligase [Selenomonadaceae bacterium]